MTELRVGSPRARRYDVDPGPDPQPSCGGLTVGRAPEPPAETPRVLLLAAIGEGLTPTYQMREHGEHSRADRLEQRVSQLQALLPHYF